MKFIETLTFSRKDLIASVLTGLTAGIITWQILNFLKAPSFGLPTSHPHALFIIIVPILWILGVNLGYFLGRRMPFFNQFGKFAAIGFTNAAVDFGILNIFIAYSGIASGLLFSVFKALSFVGATLHSYGWNKYWAFEAGQSRQGGAEFAKFFGVTVAALLVNVATASTVVNGLDPLFGLDENVWANIGAVAGSAAALVFSFVGFRLVVFNKSEARNPKSETKPEN